MGIERDKLLNWLATHRAELASDGWWESEWLGGKMAALQEIDNLIRADFFSDLKKDTND